MITVDFVPSRISIRIATKERHISQWFGRNSLKADLPGFDSRNLRVLRGGVFPLLCFPVVLTVSGTWPFWDKGVLGQGRFVMEFLLFQGSRIRNAISERFSLGWSNWKSVILQAYHAHPVTPPKRRQRVTPVVWKTLGKQRWNTRPGCGSQKSLTPQKKNTTCRYKDNVVVTKGIVL